MAILDTTLDLQSFYPSDLKILNVEDTDEKIIIHMHSTSTSCTCHQCGALLQQHHGSHHRTVQDLPILGKQVILDMQIFDYKCRSKSCVGCHHFIDAAVWKKKATHAELFKGLRVHKEVIQLNEEDKICPEI